MYIEGNALILGDSSYLEHHGIRGQRWGVRRFQNRDGSLTNAGRKRLGYATKGVTQTVGKAFKAGVKAGGNAVKAVKAHHEKKEVEKLQKKKEKASKTRLGVMANKDLFTNEEIRKLNDRFKLEDEMKLATLQKGVEIAKAVGTIAQNVGTVAKTYEDVTGQSLSPIKRKAAEEKARQDKEDRERRIAREDADEARKAAKEERDIAIHEQTLRKAIASADTQEFTAQKTKAEADSSILDLYKKGQDFNGGSDATGKSWVEKATAGGKNPFDKMLYDSDPEYKAAKDAHDEKVARKERMEYLDRREKEREAEKAAKDQALRDMINQSNARTGRDQPETPEPTKSPRQDSDALFSQKGSLPIDKDRYRNNRAMEKAKQVKEDAAEERDKKHDEKAAKAAIDTIIKDYQAQDDRARNLNPSGYDRQVALNVIKDKARNVIDKVKHPVDTAAKKISNKAREEKWAKERAKLYEEYQDDREKLGPEFANEAYMRAKRQSLQNLGYRGDALEKKLNENSFSKKKKAKHDAFSIQNGVLFIDSSDSFAHHGVKGQRWGVRKFQNADGSLTEKGRKHYEKAIEKLNRKQTHSDARRGRLERQHPFAVTGAAILGAVAAGMSIAATGGASVAAIAAGSAISAAVSAGVTHASYSINEAWEGRGTKHRQKKRKEYEEMLNHDGMYHIENGTLFINAGEPYLEHHGVKGMKWGKHLMAGKGVDAGAGGGSGEDDEKLKEMAKKAGMSVAEYRTKMASKIGGAASKVGSAVYDAAGGSHKKNAEGWRKMAQEESNAARASEKSSHENSARAASQDRKYGSGGDAYRRAAESDKENAETHRSNAKARSERAASEQAAYEKSLAGKYDKMKADRARKKSARQDKVFSETSPKEKKRLKDVAGELYGSKHRKDFERNARLLEGSTRSAVEIGRDTYKRHGPTSGFGDPTYKATDDAYKRANKQWNKARISGQKYDRSIAKRVDSLARKVSKARKTTEQKKLFSGTSPKAKKAVIAKKKATPASYEKRVNDAKNSVEKAARANENAYKHAKAVYRQTGSDSDAYKQAIKRSGTTLQRYIDSKKLLEKKKRAKHLDETGAIYTEGTRLVVNSKWG